MPASSTPSPLKGLFAGTLGGLVGTLALDIFKQTLMRGSRQVEDLLDAPNTYSLQQERQTKNYHSAHAETAEQLADAVGTSLTRAQRKTATPITHYAFGALCGGLYGLVAEYSPAITLGQGTLYGCIVFALGNEVILPALDLLPPTQKTPPVLHLEGFASHALYGAGIELTRSVLRKP